MNISKLFKLDIIIIFSLIYSSHASALILNQKENKQKSITINKSKINRNQISMGNKKIDNKEKVNNGPEVLVESDEMRRIGGGQIGDVLFPKSGFTSTTTAPGASSAPVIRGLKGYNSQILENGIRP